MLENIPRGYSGLVRPSSDPSWIVGEVHRTAWIFIGVWSITLLLENLFVFYLFLEGAWSAPSIFFSQDYQPLYLMKQLRFRRVCCASAFLGTPEVTNLPNAHDAKVNARWRRRWRREEESDEVPRHLPPTTEASSAVFWTPITHCRATRASLLARPHLSSSPLHNLLLRAPTHNKNKTQTTTQQNKSIYMLMRAIT